MCGVSCCCCLPPTLHYFADGGRSTVQPHVQFETSLLSRGMYQKHEQNINFHLAIRYYKISLKKKSIICQKTGCFATKIDDNRRKIQFGFLFFTERLL